MCETYLNVGSLWEGVTTFPVAVCFVYNKHRDWVIKTGLSQKYAFIKKSTIFANHC